MGNFDIKGKGIFTMNKEIEDFFEKSCSHPNKHLYNLEYKKRLWIVLNEPSESQEVKDANNWIDGYEEGIAYAIMLSDNFESNLNKGNNNES